MIHTCVADKNIESAQRKICEHYSAAFIPACDWVNSGYATKTEGLLPINGLRHPVTEDTTGWYIWCGESYSDEANFFQPIHTVHLYEKLKIVAELMALPPGYRFLVAGKYVDVWFDSSLVKT